MSSSGIEPLYPERISPMIEAEIAPDLLASMEPWRMNGRLFNLFLTYAHNPKMSDAWAEWGAFVFARSSLSGRQTELIVLRTTWLCRSVYEFAHHTMVATQRGLDEAEIEAVARSGSSSDQWDPADRAVLQIAEEVEANAAVSDETWTAAAEVLSEQQLMDAVMTCGTYRIGSIMTNSLGIQLEDDLPISPTLLAVINDIETARV